MNVIGTVQVFPNALVTRKLTFVVDDAVALGALMTTVPCDADVSDAKDGKLLAGTVTVHAPWYVGLSR